MRYITSIEQVKQLERPEEWVLVLTPEQVRGISTIPFGRIFNITHYLEYMDETDIEIFYPMDTLDFIYQDCTHSEVLRLMSGNWFSIEDEYFIIEDNGELESLESLTTEEAERYFLMKVDEAEFIRWALEPGSLSREVLLTHLEDVAQEIKRQWGLGDVILDLRTGGGTKISANDIRILDT